MTFWQLNITLYHINTSTTQTGKSTGEWLTTFLQVLCNFLFKNIQTTTCTYPFDKLVTHLGSRTKFLGLQGHVLFGLGVKSGILNQCIHKYPDVALDLGTRSVKK